MTFGQQPQGNNANGFNGQPYGQNQYNPNQNSYGQYSQNPYGQNQYQYAPQNMVCAVADSLMKRLKAYTMHTVSFTKVA